MTLVGNPGAEVQVGTPGITRDCALGKDHLLGSEGLR